MDMEAPELNHLTEREKASYSEGLAIVAEKLYQARLTKPTADELHRRSLAIGISQNRAKLAKARNAKKPAPFVPSRKHYDSNGRKTLNTGGVNAYYRNGRKCISSGSII